MGEGKGVGEREGTGGEEVDFKGHRNTRMSAIVEVQ